MKVSKDIAVALSESERALMLARYALALDVAYKMVDEIVDRDRKRSESESRKE